MIEFRQVKKSFNSQVVLDGVDLEIKRGETMVIIGRSGSGKSVMLKHIVGLLVSDSGQVLVDGVDVGSLDKDELYKLRRQFGVLFQSGALINWLSVFGNISLPLREHTDMKGDDIKATVTKKLKLLHLEEHAEKMPSDLSGGMRKRAGLARAIVLDPEILLYDEPTSGLDPVMASRINELINSVHKELGVTSIIVTHDMTSAYRVADRIAMLYMGKIIEVGTPDEISNSSNDIVRQFIDGRIEGPME